MPNSGMDKLSLKLKLSFYFLVFVVYFIFTGSQFDHNDFMYGTAPTFDGALYDEIHYVQAPLSFYFLRFLVTLAPHDHIYAVLRASSSVLSFFSLIMVAEHCFSVNKAKIAFILLATTNLYFACSAFEIGSYALLLFLLSCVLALSHRLHDSELSIFLVGVLLGLAGSSKLNHLLFIVPLIFYLVLSHLNLKRKILQVAILLSGFIVGCLPIEVAFFSNPFSFLSHNMLFHTDFTYHFRGLDLKQQINSILYLLIQWLNQGGIYLLALSVVSGFKLIKKQIINPDQFLLALLLLVTSFLVAFSPGVGLRQYFVPVSFFSIYAVTLIYQEELQRSSQLGINGVGLVIWILFTQQMINFLPNFYSAYQSGSTINEVGRVNKELKIALKQFDQTKCQNKIFTYSGIFTLDADVQLSQFTEAGVFWTRLQGFIPSAVLENKKNAINSDLLNPENFVAHASDINILMLGYYADYIAAREDALLQVAKQRGFQQLALINTRLSSNPLQIWVNPECLN